MVNSIPKADLPLLQQLQSEVHVWFSNPESVTDLQMLAGYQSMLSADEQARLQRFHFEKDRHSFLVSHALVRKVLSTYVEVDPADWQFSAGRYGRPEIAGPAGVPALRFNLTHTAGLAGCVVTLDDACGVDAELITDRGNLLAIAGKMFSNRELEVLGKLHGQAFLEQFFMSWTLREAYCKALGTGIGFSKKNFGFETGSDGQVRICFDAPAADPDGHWQFTLLRPAAEHFVAVAVCSDRLSDKTVVHQYVTP